MHVLGICGSLRSGSYNRLLLRAAARELPPGVEFVLYEELGDLPAYNEDADREPVPRPVRRLRERISCADAVVIATPEYNASIPGALKNALDWASRPFSDNCLRGKRVAVVGASTGIFGAVSAQAELRKVLRVIGAEALDAELPVASAHAAFEDGRLRPGRLEAALATIVHELVSQRSRSAA